MCVGAVFLLEPPLEDKHFSRKLGSSMEFRLPLSGSHDQTAASYRNWQQMKQRFREHILLQHKDKNLSAGGSASLLMFISGDKIRDVMKSLPADAHHKNDMLDDTLEHIEDLCMPGFMLLYERFKFWSVRQQRFEDLRNFVSKLQILADFCELHELRQKYVTDRIVDGVRSEALKKRLRSISDLEFQQALEICEDAQGDRIKKYVDVACKEISGEKEVVRRKACPARRMRGVVNGKSSVVKKKCSVDEKKNCVKEKTGRQCSKLTDDQLQMSAQTKPRKNRSARITRAANVADAKKPRRNRSVRTRTTNVANGSQPDGCTGAVAVETASPSSCLTPILRQPLTEHAHSVKTLRTRQMRKSNTQSLVSKLNHKSNRFKTRTAPESIVSCHPVVSPYTPNSSVLPKCQARTKQGIHVGLDSASRDAVDNQVYYVGKINESQASVREEIRVEYPNMDYFMHLKSEPENANPCQLNTDSDSQNKHTRKCSVYEREFSSSVESQCQPGSHLDKEVDASSVCDIGPNVKESLSWHMKQTHLDLLRFPCEKCGVLFECQAALDQHKSSLCTKEPQSTISRSRLSHSAGSRSTEPHSGVSHSARSHSTEPHSGVSHSAGSRSTEPHSGVSHSAGSRSTEPHSVVSHSAGSRSTEPHSGVSHSAGSRSTEPHSEVSHSTDQSVMCRDCGVSLTGSRQYYQHRKTEHRKLGCDCDQCGLSFAFPSKLKLHQMSKHKATKPFMCEICGSAFAERNLLTTHKNIHSGQKKHECPTCGRRFLLKTTLHNHVQTHLDRRPHTCNICGMGFKLSYYLKSHMKTHSENRERPHICSRCGAAFLKLAQLKNHERKHTGEKPYRCQMCGIQFSQLSSMKKHVRHIHEGIKPTDRFSCEYCGLSFTHSCKLKLHLMKHTGERPFACHFCASTYREKHQLNTHMKIHSASEPFKCPFCTRRFLQKSSLEGHVRKHTGEKPFQCPVCFQNFSHKGYLRDHVKVHDENRERKYKCSICDKSFTCSSHMRSHEKLHSGDKPHTCHICGSRFTKRSSVKKHLKRTHGIHDATAIQAQSSSIGAEASDDAAAGSILSSMLPVHGSDRRDQATNPQCGTKPQIQMDTQTLTETHTDRSVDIRPTESVQMPVQNQAELQLSHIHSVIRPEALSDIHPQPQPGMCVGVDPSLPRQVHQHPSIRILHPALLHTAVQVHGDPQMIPCVAPAISTQTPQSELIQDMLVYTLAT